MKTTSWPRVRRSADTGRPRGTSGPLFIGKDSHALSDPATRSALEVLAANGVSVLVDSADGLTPTPAVSHAILTYNRGRTEGLADGIVVTPSPQPAGGRRLQVQPAKRRPGRHGRNGGHPGRGERSPRSPAFGRPRVPYEQAVGPAGRPRLHRHLRRRPRERRRHGGHPRLRAETRRGSARRCERRILGRDSRPLRPRPDRHERSRRSSVRVHDRGLGRPDPDGSLVAVRDGPAGRTEGPIRRGLRQRHRRGPPRHRLRRGRPDEP